MLTPVLPKCLHRIAITELFAMAIAPPTRTALDSSHAPSGRLKRAETSRDRSRRRTPVLPRPVSLCAAA